MLATATITPAMAQQNWGYAQPRAAAVQQKTYQQQLKLHSHIECLYIKKSPKNRGFSFKLFFHGNV